MKSPRIPSPKFKGSLIAWLLLASTLIPLFSLIQPTYAPLPWWNENWNFRKQIILNHNVTKTDLTNFPIIINLTDTDLKSKVRFDGGDIVFTDTGNNTLPHEIELYDSSTGHLLAWVKIPLLSATIDTEICMYYGNPNAPNQQNPAAVWDANYAMVLHMKEASGTRYDSTSHGNNAIPTGTVTKAPTGKIDGADLFSSNGYERVTQGFLPANAITIEIWLKPTSYSPTIWTKFLNTGPTTTKGMSGGQTYKTADRWYVGLTWDSGAKSFNTGDITSGYTWNHIVISWNGTYCYAYRNGLKIKEGAASGVPDWFGKPLYLGSNYVGTEGFKGAFDEVRVSNITRSTDWIQAGYNDQNNPNAYYAVGVEETNSYSPLVFENPPNEATGIYTNPTLSVRAVDPNGLNMTITFKQKISSNWITLKTYENAPDGTYIVIPTQMQNLSTTYYWSVYVTDGQASTNKTFAITTTDKILQQKWMVTGIPSGVSGVLAADINNDGVDEVIHAGKGGVVALNGTTGAKIWNLTDAAIGDHAQAQMADLNRDGILEIVVSLETPAGILALRANNGSTYWRTMGLGGETFSGPVIFDIDGNGYPTIFVGSTDTSKGLNGTGRLTSLSYDGRILHQTFIWRPCSGGLSIADTDHDGEFEVYMGERNMYLNDPLYGDNDYGKGVISFWARNLTLRWYRPEIFCSSQKPMIADVNNDGILDIITGDLGGGIAVLNSTDGSTIRMTLGIPNDAPTHYQPSIYDIDGDGNLEMLMADFHNTTSDDLVIWDLTKWKVDARFYLGKCFYGPQLADVNGDGLMEIIACNFKSIFIIDRAYHIIDGIVGLSGEVSSGGDVRNIDGLSGLSGTLNYAVAQDIDGDGYTELIVSTQGGSIYAFDTPARRPNPRPRTEVQFYSEYRLGAAEYVQPQGGPAPVISSPNPPNSATEVPLSSSELQFTLTDFQHDLMSYTVTTSPNIGSANEINKGNARYTVPISNLAPSTTYTWTINATDGIHKTTRTYTFITESVSPWWNGNWKYCKNIIIDHTKVAADLSNFPVLVEITDSDLASKARLDGYDIAFTDANNNKLDSEIEFYNSATGHLIAWINVPNISSTIDTIINMYYGNPSAPNQQNPTATWDSNYVMVQHLEEPSGTRFDSTSNKNNGTAYNGVSKSKGKIDGADLFDGVNDYLLVSNSPSLNPSSAITIEFWINSSLTGNYMNLVNKGTYGQYYLRMGPEAGRVFWYVKFNDGTAKSVEGNVGWTTNSWYHLVVTLDTQTQTIRLYLNGIEKLSGTFSSGKSIIATTNSLLISDISQRWIKGSTDEVRISNIARSSTWVQTSYNNQKDPAAFFILGTEKNAPEAPVVFNPSPSNKATGISRSLSELSFNLADGQGDLMSYTVTTDPFIGSGAGTNVANGRFTVAVSGLQYFTTYKWHVNVTDGTHWTNVTYTFTTLLSEPPTQDNPLLTIDGGGNLVCYNQSTYDPNGDTVTNTYNWYRNNTSLTNLLMPFNTNSSTTVKDYSGYGNDGIAIRGATWTNNGKVGGAYRFDKGFIQVPGSRALDGGGYWSEITVEHWIYLTASQSGTRTVARLPSYEIGITGNKIFATIWVVTGSGMISGCNRLFSNTTLQTNRWYHIALTYKSGVGMTLYIDGTQDATKPLVTGNIQPSGSNPLYIGWLDYFKGMIDEVAIYPKSLSQQQIFQNYIDTRNGLSNSATIVSQETRNGEQWKCEITPNDSHQDGTTKPSNPVVIGSNNKPTAKDLTITPANPRTDNNLTASYTFFDPDGDPNQSETRWFKNNILQPGLNDTLIVPHGLTAKGEVWHFTVRPYDGKEYGGTKTSADAMIQNTPPNITSWSPITDPTINKTQSQTFNVTCSDLDGDTLNITWHIYYSNGTLREQTAGYSYTFYGNLGEAGTYTIIAKVSDGQNQTSHQWTITVNQP